MAPWFVHWRLPTPLVTRRRKRWSEQWTPLLFACSLILDRLASPGVVDVLPVKWQPYIRGASAAFGLTALAAFREKRLDYLNYLERLKERDRHPLEPKR